MIRSRHPAASPRVPPRSGPFRTLLRHTCNMERAAHLPPLDIPGYVARRSGGRPAPCSSLPLLSSCAGSVAAGGIGSNGCEGLELVSIGDCSASSPEERPARNGPYRNRLSASSLASSLAHASALPPELFPGGYFARSVRRDPSTDFFSSLLVLLCHKVRSRSENGVLAEPMKQSVPGGSQTFMTL